MPSSRVRSVKMFWKVKYSSRAGRSTVGVEARQRHDRLLLRGEGKAAAAMADIERLDAVAVAGEQQPALLAVPEGEGEHAVEPVERRDAPFDQAVENDFASVFDRNQ